MITPRRRQIVELAETTPSKIIARRLGISPSTVKNLLHRAYRQLGVGDRKRAAEMVRNER